MSRFKLSVLARSLTLLASVGAPCFAQAADLLPPPPPPPLPAPVEVGGGWYLRGDVGVGATSLHSVELRTTGAIPPGYHNDGATLGDQFFAGGGVGYQFNNFLRADVTAEYRGGGHLSFTDVYNGFYGDGTPGTGLDYNTGHLSSVVVMANGYVDLGCWYGLTPYIGGGAGQAFHRLSGFTDIGAGTAAGGFGTAKQKDTSSFAWNLQAGVSYDITPNFKVDVGYRYMNLGHFSTGTVSCYNSGCSDSYGYKIKDITSHDVKIGLRYMLGGVAAPLPPVYEPPPGPIVRKY